MSKCPGAGRCQSMIGNRHQEWAQRGLNLKRKGAAEQRMHTLDELHSIPNKLVEEVIFQIMKVGSILIYK